MALSAGALSAWPGSAIAGPPGAYAPDKVVVAYVRGTSTNARSARSAGAAAADRLPAAPRTRVVELAPGVSDASALEHHPTEPSGVTVSPSYSVLGGL